MRYRRNSNGYAYILHHARIDGDIADLIRHCQTSAGDVFEDGGL